MNQHTKDGRRSADAQVLPLRGRKLVQCHMILKFNTSKPKLFAKPYAGKLAKLTFFFSICRLNVSRSQPGPRDTSTHEIHFQSC